MSVFAGRAHYQAICNGISLADNLLACNWEHTSGELASRAMVKIGLHPSKNTDIGDAIGIGANLRIQADRLEVFNGAVFGHSYALGAGAHSLTLTAYDRSRYLAQSEDDVSFSDGVTSHTRLGYLSQAFSVPFGRIDVPNIWLPAATYRQKKPSDILLDTLDLVYLMNGGEYVIVPGGNPIDIIAPGTNGTIYHFTADDVQAMADERDIESLVTRVKVIGAFTALSVPGMPGVTSNVAAIRENNTQFGTMQKLVYQDTPELDAAVKQAEAILAMSSAPRRMQRIEAPDVPEIRKGDKCFFAAGTLNGYHVVSGVRHIGETRRMELEIDTSGTLSRRLRLEKTVTSFGDIPPGSLADYIGVPQPRSVGGAGAGQIIPE